MRSTFKALMLLFVIVATGTQASPWSPSAGHTQMDLWPSTPPNSISSPAAEQASEVTDSPVAGRSWTQVENVSRPTLTVYAPQKDNTGAAKGGHAFGLRQTAFPITAWPKLVEAWLKTIG